MRIPAKETLIAGACVAILCGMGTWQVQRLHWKNHIIAELEESYTRKDQQLTVDLLAAVNKKNRDFAYGTIQGHLLKDKAILLGPRVLDGRSGYNLLIPLELHNNGTLIVDTGWVSDLWNDTRDERLATLPMDVTVRGLVRYPDYSAMASNNSPENDLWFRADPLEIAKAKDLDKPHAVLLFADHIDPPLQDVFPHEEKFLPRNKHMQYALFWYSMAAAMLGVYGFYVYGLNKKPKE
jgi:surfeit locus 1 family protein